MIDAIEFACVSTAFSPDSRGRSGAGAGLIRFLAVLGLTLIPMAAGALPVDQTPSAADAMMLVTAMRAGAGFHLPEMLTSFTTLPTMGPAPAYFDAVRNRVVVRVPGTVLDGYDFRGTRVAVAADNVTISNSGFNAVAGFFTVDQYPPYSGMTIDSCLFDGEKVNRDLEAFIGARLGKATITNNRMIDAPSDMIRIGNGVVSGNYMAGTGYQTAAHADAITVSKTSGPVLITGNFIDWTPRADAMVDPNEAVRITNEPGPVDGVTVSGNVALGGSFTYFVGLGGASTTNPITRISITGNILGLGQFGDLWIDPTFVGAVTASGTLRLGGRVQ